MVVFFIVSILASVIGAICGIGGGVVIKPVLDLLSSESVSTISFLSGCTVLSMSSYSMLRAQVKKEKLVEFSIGTPLAVGAIIGGVAGKKLFLFIKEASSAPETLGMIQAVVLGVVTIGTLIYTINKSKIKTYNIKNKFICIIIGFSLGIMSSFLGIGGGPINLVVLFFFFSMTTKAAAANSLYIIFFSQLANLVTAFATKAVPEFDVLTLVLMILGGIGGGIIGRAVNKKINSSTIDKLFIGLMVVIVLICIYNSVKYFI